MTREKTILAMVFIIFSLVAIETIFIFSPKFTIKNSEPIQSSDLVSNIGNKKTKKTHPPSLNSSGWINDIFYDRSNIYDDWFSLTGIMQFEDGKKAIINDEILRTGDRVKGFTVKKILDNQVVLTRNKYQVNLNLEK
jgi:hypothetical protein|tara:strand:- start:3868 stop:4278 length:411 start_codon:yes stop_codon:yes gene_type:complete